MSRRPIAYVMEQTLGNITHYLNLRQESSQSGECRWLPIEYQSGKLPWTMRGSLYARSALGPILREVDGVFIHTATLAPLAVDYFLKVPAVLSTDGTPMNKRSMRAAYGLKPEGLLAEQAKRLLYRGIFAQARGFVAWSRWAKQSFVEDYGCREEDVAVIPPGIDVERFRPAPEPESRQVPRVLFVGGDFSRKGGDLLLEVFKKRFRGKAELALVTRADVPEGPGVHVYKDLHANSEKLLELYATSDVFALPTAADCFSIVCQEALAAGLPIVTTRVGGIRDLIDEGETGYGVPVGDGAALGDALEALIENPTRRGEMSKKARAQAIDRFDIKKTARALFEFVRSRC